MARDSSFLLCQESPGVIDDFCKLFLGEKIGSGSTREVFTLATDVTKVVKIETTGRSFQNVAEWDAWLQCRYDKTAAKWLAPCRHISPSGIILIMDRTEPMGSSRSLKKVPVWLSDIHIKNFGMLGKRMVCHDYGYLSGPSLSRRMKTVKW